MRMPVTVVCPRCEQGWVVEQVVVATGERWRVCEECDAVWDALEPVRAPGFEDLSSMLRAHGLAPGSRLRPPAPTDPDPVVALADAFGRSHDPDPVVRAQAVGTLAPAVLGTDAGARLTTLLDDPDPEVAAAAAAGLVRYGDEASVGAVAARARDADEPVRSAVVHAVTDVAARYVFTAHRLVAMLDAGAEWPADVEQGVRRAVAEPT